MDGITGAVVVAGGASRRMGGVDKAAMAVAGATMLDRVLAAARPLCSTSVVVGPRRPVQVAGVTFVQEPEPGGGPVPAVVAGLSALGRPEAMFVLAVDLPLLTTAALARLLEALDQHPDCDAAAALDDRGRPNPLLATYRFAATRAWTGPRVAAGAPASVLLPQSVVTVDLGARVTLNVNRPSDLRRADAMATSARQRGARTP